MFPLLVAHYSDRFDAQGIEPSVQAADGQGEDYDSQEEGGEDEEEEMKDDTVTESIE